MYGKKCLNAIEEAAEQVTYQHPKSTISPDGAFWEKEKILLSARGASDRMGNLSSIPACSGTST
ncbi:hypothetical protein OAE97_03010 [Verrucomicrobia bacterium]|nr:hypothetical protein [Verrucomicrobiota bacterium]